METAFTIFVFSIGWISAIFVVGLVIWWIKSDVNATEFQRNYILRREAPPRSSAPSQIYHFRIFVARVVDRALPIATSTPALIEGKAQHVAEVDPARSARIERK